MNQNCLPNDKRDCPFCGKKNSLSYYRQSGMSNDLYYCEKCYEVVIWNGRSIRKAKTIQAYPNREKVETRS